MAHSEVLIVGDHYRPDRSQGQPRRRALTGRRKPGPGRPRGDHPRTHRPLRIHTGCAFNATSADAAQPAEQLDGIGSVITVGGDTTELTDPDRYLAAAFGIDGSRLVAVRPDGYIGLVADTASPAALEKHLVTSLNRAATG